MTQTEQAARRILLTALSAEVGLKVRVTPVGDIMTPTLRARQTFYKVLNSDIDFKDLRVRLDPNDPDNFIWIIKSRFFNEEPRESLSTSNFALGTDLSEEL
jgi:hypothetical protein